MPAKNPEQEARDIALAAYWRVAKPELSADALAKLIGTGRSTLDRRLAKAEEQGLIAQDWIFKQMPGRLWEELAKTTDKDFIDRMERKYGEEKIPELHVVPTWPPRGPSLNFTDADIAHTNMQMVAHRAAQVFLNRLDDMKVIGLCYGRTLRTMVDILEHFSAVVKKVLEKGSADTERTIVTLFGSLSFHFNDKRHSEWLEYSASHLTNRLARIIGTNICKRRFLETPVYVPPAFLDLFTGKGSIETELGKISKKISEAEALQIAKAFVRPIPTYHDAFVGDQSDRSAIEELDTIITSVGDLGTGFGSVPKDEVAPLLRPGELAALHEEAVGDIAGRYVTEEGDAGSPGSTVAKVNERIFGLTLEDLERTVQRAEENGKPGVIVIASSKKKARVIRALINRPKKVISELIVSGDLAEELAPPKKVRKKSKQTLA